MLFKRVFKKKVKKKKKKDEEEKERKGGLTKKDLEDWANLQQMLKDKEGGEPPGPPKPSEKELPKEKQPIRQGYNYLFEEFRPVNAYRIFFKLVGDNPMGLCITSTYPQKIRDMYDVGFETVPIFWLSDWYGASQEFLNIGTEERTLRPTRLDFEIMKEISNFIKRSRGRGILILDGIESLVLANTFEKVISFLTNVNNMASANRCTIIAPINPGVFRRRDRFILEKIYDDVRSFVKETDIADED